jgi:hypothetical protein
MSKQCSVMRWNMVDEINWFPNDMAAEIASGGIAFMGGVQATKEGLAKGE